MPKTFPFPQKKNRQKFRYQFSLGFWFVLLRFRVVLGDGTTKNVLQKNRQKKTKPMFSRFCLSRFWAFLREGSSKTP
jgi:hypothetical protein